MSDTGRHGKRSREGCLTCRKRHYKCDERLPNCARCQTSRLVCVWPLRKALRQDIVRAHSELFATGATMVELDRLGREIVVDQNSLRRQRLDIALSTRQVETLAYYIANFHKYSYQICAWTNLIELPRRSPIPTILLNEEKGLRKMTNWATYFLPHLTLGTTEDPLTLSLAAFTALRMNHHELANSIYYRSLGLLRSTLNRKNASSMNNQDFLRIWSTTLMLAEFEAHLGNQKFESQHVEGATTLSFIAAARFSLARYSDTGETDESTDSDSFPLGGTTDTTEEHKYGSPQGKTSVPRNEQQLPAYLMQLTQRLRHSSAVCESLDTEWPTFQEPPMERHSLGGLLEQSAQCYALVMPLVEAYYTRMATSPPRHPGEYEALMHAFAPRVSRARAAIQQYRMMLEPIVAARGGTYQSCAEPGFPFSPVIRCLNPQLVQPVVIPHIFIMFLAPFISDREHQASIRFISGAVAGFAGVPGLRLTASFPDIYVAAYWRRGEERAYFIDEMAFRNDDFKFVLSQIWEKVDHIEVSEKRLANKTEILGISLKEYRAAQTRGLQLQHTRH